MKTKNDARKLDGATQAHMRKMVVQAVRGGMTQTAAVANIYGVSLRAVSKWMKLSREGGWRALRPGKRGRQPGSGRLNHTQAVRIRKLIIERMPDQLALPFYLWTRESVAQLIEQQYGITVSATTAGRYLKAWGMSAQKPVRRAYERNDAAIARWLDEDYPTIAKEAKQEEATILWGDETGLRSDHLSGTSFALKGRTPLVRATGQRFGCNMISAISNRGMLSFMVFEGTDVQECNLHRIHEAPAQAGHAEDLPDRGRTSGATIRGRQALRRRQRRAPAPDPAAGVLP
ncbi:IS630 family transposase [Paraburkholderia sp. JPY419]|uniref:IS630 family transposase n=1 Tax=Paraburkholderia sp. JPY419 TaxID=667660 RepID=UPI003D24B082